MFWVRKTSVTSCLSASPSPPWCSRLWTRPPIRGESKSSELRCKLIIYAPKEKEKKTRCFGSHEGKEAANNWQLKVYLMPSVKANGRFSLPTIYPFPGPLLEQYHWSYRKGGREYKPKTAVKAWEIIKLNVPALRLWLRLIVWHHKAVGLFYFHV